MDIGKDKEAARILSAYVPRELYEQFKEIADAEHRTISRQVVMLMTKYVAEKRAA